MAGVLFLHIPKAAGTSLRNALIKTFGPCPTPFGGDRVTEGNAKAWASFPLISGHMSRDDQLRWFPDRRIFTALRDPIDRCISNIYYFKSVPAYMGPVVAAAHELPVMEFVEQPATQQNMGNVMVRQLGGHLRDESLDLPALLERAKETLLQAEWVGFSDTLAADFSRVSDVPILCENVTPNRPAADDLPHGLIPRLREMNVYDDQLWAWARDTLGH